jgi:response regulator RpfG family c-di-GMP phosphodiesterase
MTGWEPRFVREAVAPEVDSAPPLHAVDALPAPSSPKRTITLPGTVEPADVVRALLGNGQAAGEARSAHLWLADPTTETVRLVHASGSGAPEPTPVSLHDTVIGRAIESGQSQLEPVSSQSPGEPACMRWQFAVPLVAGEAHGVAAIDFDGRAKPDLERLTQVAGAMRGCLAGALALQVARAEAGAARALADTSRDLARMLDPDAVIAMALERAMAVSGAQTGSVMLLDGEGKLYIAASRGLPPEVVSDTRVTPGGGIAGWVLASGSPLVVEDLKDHGPASRRHGVLSAVSVPIGDDDGLIGVMNVGSRAFHARLSESLLQALESLGRTTAVAYRNARAAYAACDLYFDTLKALAVAMESKDPYSFGSSTLVLDIALAIGDSMSLKREERDALRVAAMLHDIGMAAASEVASVADRQLSTVEWGLLKMHPAIAAEILTQVPALRDAVPIVYHHHEHYDGAGYLGGLAGSEIPLGARILAVADAFVAMTSERPYRPALTQAEAIAELHARSGSQFDPHVVAALVDLLSGGKISAPARKE